MRVWYFDNCGYLCVYGCIFVGIMVESVREVDRVGLSCFYMVYLEIGFCFLDGGE